MAILTTPGPGIKQEPFQTIPVHVESWLKPYPFQPFQIMVIEMIKAMGHIPRGDHLGLFLLSMCRWHLGTPTPLYYISDLFCCQI